MRTMLASVGLAILMMGCSARPQASGVYRPVTMDSQVRGLMGEMERLEEGLGLERAPDCPRAMALGERICQLAGQICEIAGRDPSDRELQALCLDGRRRCERCRGRVRDHCQGAMPVRPGASEG